MLTNEADRRFDPLVVKILVNLMGLYPLGTPVRLDSGELAVVYHSSNDPQLFEKPWVRVVKDAAGARVRRTLIRNLAEHQGAGGVIVASLSPEELGDLDPGIGLIG